MTILEDILKKRSNITFFRQDKVPSKEIIEEILKKTHSLTPHKNNFIQYEVEVYGPEYDEDKKYATLSTVCSDAKDMYRKSENPNDFVELEKIYEKWLWYHKTKVKSYENKDFIKMREDLNKYHFNQQIRAPYLLVYSKKTNNIITNSQKESSYFKTGKLNKVFNVDHLANNNMWLVQSGMHGIITSMLAVEKGLDASFCKCFFYNTHIHSNILRKAVKKSDNIAFTLGLGYKDEKMMKYKSFVPKPKLDEIVKWQ
jgi:hypothetical protein